MTRLVAIPLISAFVIAAIILGFHFFGILGTTATIAVAAIWLLGIAVTCGVAWWHRLRVGQWDVGCIFLLVLSPVWPIFIAGI